MPSRDSVRRLIAMVEDGRTVEAMQEFYADNATMQENNKTPRRGLSTLLAYEQNVVDSFEAIYTHPDTLFNLDEDQVVINWIFDMTDREGRTFRLDELAHQTWIGEKICRERFYYDTTRQWLDPAPPGSDSR